MFSLQAVRDAVEQSIDQGDLATFLESVVIHICHEKAAHLQENWQDETAARSWDRDATKLQRLVAKLEN
jgi:hypothetical protein